MPKLNYFMEIFHNEFSSLQKLPSYIGSGYLTSGKPFEPKKAAADYLFSRINYMLTKYALYGAIDGNEFAKKNMINFVLPQKTEPDTISFLRLKVNYEIQFISEYNFGYDNKTMKKISNSLMEFSEKIKNSDNYNDLLEAHKRIIGKIPAVYQAQLFEDVSQNVDNTIKIQNFYYKKYNMDLHATMLKLISGEKWIFEDFEREVDKLNSIFRDYNNVDYEALKRFDGLKNENDKVFNFYTAAKLSSDLKQYIGGPADTNYENLSSLATAFEAATDEASEKLSEKQLYRFASLASNPKITESYQANPESVKNHLLDTDVGINERQYKIGDQFSLHAKEYLDSMKMNCAKSMRLEYRIMVAKTEFNFMHGKGKIDEQIAIIKALEMKHESRGIFWKCFNFFRSAYEVKSIISMKENLIEHGVDKSYLKAALNENPSEQERYDVSENATEVDELFRRDVPNDELKDFINKETDKGLNFEDDKSEKIEIREDEEFKDDDYIRNFQFFDQYDCKIDDEINIDKNYDDNFFKAELDNGNNIIKESMFDDENEIEGFLPSENNEIIQDESPDDEYEEVSEDEIINIK